MYQSRKAGDEAKTVSLLPKAGELASLSYCSILGELQHIYLYLIKMEM